MKQIIFLLFLLPFSLSFAAAQTELIPAQTALPQAPAAEVSFNFTRQGGPASNQFAVWVEDAAGQYIKTLYATRWTAVGGWQRRPTSIPVWVSRSNLGEKTSGQLDAVSGATGQTGRRTFTWNGTDSGGSLVPPGNYVIYVEGTLRWENQVMFRSTFSVGQGAVPAHTSVTFSGGSTAERGMLTGVTVRALR